MPPSSDHERLGMWLVCLVTAGSEDWKTRHLRMFALKTNDSLARLQRVHGTMSFSINVMSAASLSSLYREILAMIRQFLVNFGRFFAYHLDGGQQRT
ncbi:hypothetical protein CYMTET_56007 [Cymbomonas tetramitiformis]|uniref:Uncharacterized protein n=1 Tax=Cymbomonas tetramitiformis TaxID=36881 RepID=A0AAE0BBU0_9CHLO|nr:hypothetical protein CYMTET_56007 [Cymbomonas tetramitiformis]